MAVVSPLMVDLAVVLNTSLWYGNKRKKLKDDFASMSVKKNVAPAEDITKVLSLERSVSSTWDLRAPFHSGGTTFYPPKHSSLSFEAKSPDRLCKRSAKKEAKNERDKRCSAE